MTSLAAVVSLNKHKDCTARRGVDYWRVNLSITLAKAGKFAPDSQSRIAELQTQGSMSVTDVATFTSS